jgi:CHAT domain-containing protein
VVPDGPLEQIPFAALRDGATRRYLVEMAQLTVAPSATLYLKACDRRAPGELPDPRSVLVLGEPDLSSSPYAGLPPLPGARAEGRAIARLYSTHKLLEGSDADRKGVLEAIDRFSALHFAGHAISFGQSVPGPRLLLTPADSGDTGELPVAELRELRLNHTELVVLAACRAMGGYAEGREGVLDIARSFFAAGVPTVVAALWEVEDRVSYDLMTRFHRRYSRGADASTALRNTMIELIESGDPQKSAPSYWAVYAMLGG